MVWEKGKPRPEGAGRKKGTPNRKTQTLEQFFDDHGLFVPERIVLILPTLEGRDQAKVLLELMQYLYPKRKAIEHSGSIDTNPYMNKSVQELEDLVKAKMEIK
jgi:hypothetical protein